MPWLVPWNGQEHDFDPTDFTGRELSEIKRVAGFPSYMALMNAVKEGDPDAFRAIFWTVERRTNPDLRYGDYDGPSMRVIITFLPAFDDGFGSDEDESGKAPTTDGGQPSPSNADTPETSTTT